MKTSEVMNLAIETASNQLNNYKKLKIKVTGATPVQLNYMVAKCEGIPDITIVMKSEFPVVYGMIADCIFPFQPATDWGQGGRILEREMSVKCGRMTIENETYASEKTDTYSAEYRGFNWEQSIKTYGSTPLIAAMRCLVINKLGNVVEVPEELINEI